MSIALPGARAARDSRLRPARALAAWPIVTSIGLLVMAMGDSKAREGSSVAPLAFWAGLALVAVPIFAKLAGSRLMPSQRLSFVVLLGMSLYLVKVLHSPDGFTFHDEFGQWRASADVLRTHHLFGRGAPILVAYSSYPGLEIVVTAVVHLTGLSIFAASLVVVGAARFVLMVALFQVFRVVSGSERAAGIATAVYACNPNFLFFDAQGAYESLAIPFAALVLMLAVRACGSTHDGRRPWTVLALGTGAALVATHHLTTYLLLGLLFAWGAAVKVREGRGYEIEETASPVRIAFPLAALAFFWAVFVATLTFHYLYPVFHRALSSMIDFLIGHGNGKPLFGSEAGRAQSALARMAGFASVGLLLAALPFGVVAMWRRRRTQTLTMTLALLTILYPATLALRFTRAGAETSNRASEFVFVALAPAVALAWLRLAEREQARWRVQSFAVAFLSVVGAGSLVVGWAPTARQPGPFLVAADARSVSEESIAASIWSKEHLGLNNRMTADRPNKLLFGSYGMQYPIGSSGGAAPYPQIYFSTVFTALDRRIIRRTQVRYLVVDRRLASALPVIGVYFELDERNANNHRAPLSPQSISKFDAVRGLGRTFDSGELRIYDATLLNLPVRHRNP